MKLIEMLQVLDALVEEKYQCFTQRRIPSLPTLRESEAGRAAQEALAAGGIHESPRA